ncbi:uncharacterized protein LOC125028944 [Penaeus chinensis]|uniref:uncharacterized protein LOC125028944 n=1 Tax=Penaeus chinensis TaxID=139456 RepID=UPI001FB5F57D|nr:uncharacterized protein LOC125028944 [Penaeus chinensis]
MENEASNDIFKSDGPGTNDWTDFSSVKTHLKTTLQCLQKKHKGLTLKKVQYLEKFFSHVLDHHRGSVKELEVIIIAIAPHAFNDHIMCKRTWCLELQKNVSREGKISSSKRQLIMDLKDTFSTLAYKSCELVKSSQNVNKEADIVKITLKDNSNSLKEIHPHQPENDIIKKEVNVVGNDAVQDSEPFKNLKPTRKSKRNMSEKSDCEPVQKKKSVHSIPDTGKNTKENKKNGVPSITTTTKCSNKTQSKVKKPKLEEMDINDLQSHSKVFFDLETTSLRIDCDIVQIGATDNNEEFSIYVIPNQRIDPRASAVTGLTFEQHTLKYRGKPVYAVTRLEALHKFLEWIQLRSPVVLYAHNAAFDYRRLFYAIKEENLVDSFKQHILGFVNTIAQFKVIFPKLPNYKQSTVVQKVLKKSYDAHNALGDVRALKELYNVSKSDVISKGSVTFSSAYESWLYDIHGQKKAVSL